MARPPVSSSKAESRDLNVIAAFCIGEETQNFFAVSLSHSLRFTGVQGRFLASLEMTIRGQPSTRRDERGCEIARPPVSSSKAEPRDLNAIAAFCIGEETQKFFCRIVISQSTFYRCARKISRFTRNDDMGQPSTRRDERGCEIARPLGSSSKAEPRDLNMIAAFCIGEETQNHFLPYRYLTIFALPVCKEDFSLRLK